MHQYPIPNTQYLIPNPLPNSRNWLNHTIPPSFPIFTLMQQYIPAKVLKAFIPDLQAETDSVQIKRIGNGLINHSYQISYWQLPDFSPREINTYCF